MTPGSAAAPILKVVNLVKRFGSFAAVDGVSLEVSANSIHAIIGPNGAGKTTLFHCLTGHLLPSAGRVIFAGRDVTHLPAHRRVSVGMGRSFQITNLFQNLTVFESLRLAAQARHHLRAMNFLRPVASIGEAIADAERVLERLDLRSSRGRPSGELSHGEQRILEVGLALAGGARTLFLDEPTAGMGVEDVDVMKDLIRTLAEDHTIILIEHNMSIVLTISDRISVMHQGQLLTEGTPVEVQRDERVRAAYLGSAAPC